MTVEANEVIDSPTIDNKETMGFQTEVSQLLNLMIHSLYSNKEIFLRELVSNASDAIDKLRFSALEDDSLYGDDAELSIRIKADKDAKTVTISDNGIGMSKEDAIKNLGTIAKSGTADFFSSLTGDQKKDAGLIGQFGVGFYSSFIVADRVEVFTSAAGSSAGVYWESEGKGDFNVADIEKADRGTRIVLHLKDDCIEFADDFRIRSIVKKYADHISIPVIMSSIPAPELDDEGKPKSDETPEAVDEVINTAKALWTRSRSEVEDEEYQEFYKTLSHDYDNPLLWGHNRVEGKLEYTSLLYVPSKAPFDLYNRDTSRGLKLFIQKVFIMDDAEQFMPLYLRFVKGVLDSNDLPLNISREILQDNAAVNSMKSALTKRVLDMLAKLAKSDAEKYNEFWKAFGQVLKEGTGEDFSNKDKIAKLLRFSTTKNDDEAQERSLESYVADMQEGQKNIYYITSDAYLAAKNSPHLEIFRKKSIEVLVMSDRVDEWMMGNLSEFDGKQFLHVAKGDLDLGDLEENKEEQEKIDSESEGLVARIKSVLGETVEAVKVTHRLTDSPACLVVGKDDLGVQMRQILEASGQAIPESKPTFEINPEHPLLKRLDSESDEDKFAALISILFDQANLAEGGQLKDPASYVKKLNKLLLELA